MAKKSNFSDDDIEKLFENNDSSVVLNDNSDKSDELKNKEIEIALTSDLFLPDEMNANKESKKINRPKYQASDEFKDKKEQKLKEEEIINNINKTKSISILQKNNIQSIDAFNIIASSINQLKNEERLRELEKQRILNKGHYNFDVSTDCTFHVYQPRELMGNMVYCACKYCSAYKEMTMDQWKKYQLTIKKYL